MHELCKLFSMLWLSDTPLAPLTSVDPLTSSLRIWHMTHSRRKEQPICEASNEHDMAPVIGRT
jgi:hypothetical protein